MKFVLTDHIYRILIGRGFDLVCAYKKCRMSIHVTGYGICKRCKHKLNIEEMPWSDKLQRRTSKCPKCGNKDFKMVFTTTVVSKHRKDSHLYYHADCYEKLYINVGNDEDDDESEAFFAGLGLKIRKVK